jgi:hypothetical protein
MKEEKEERSENRASNRIEFTREVRFIQCRFCGRKWQPRKEQPVQCIFCHRYFE